MLSSRLYSSPIGILRITANDTAIIGITLDDNESRVPACNSLCQPLEWAELWLDAYFCGKKPEANILPLELNGTAFQKRVWQYLCDIPYGNSVTYGQIAKDICSFSKSGNMSAQAVGQAVGANPICIVIPCHRVLGVQHRLTGYALGLEKKIWLLEYENIFYR